MFTIILNITQYNYTFYFLRQLFCNKVQLNIVWLFTAIYILLHFIILKSHGRSILWQCKRVFSEQQKDFAPITFSLTDKSQETNSKAINRCLTHTQVLGFTYNRWSKSSYFVFILVCIDLCALCCTHKDKQSMELKKTRGSKLHARRPRHVVRARGRSSPGAGYHMYGVALTRVVRLHKIKNPVSKLAGTNFLYVFSSMKEPEFDPGSSCVPRPQLPHNWLLTSYSTEATPLGVTNYLHILHGTSDKA